MAAIMPAPVVEVGTVPIEVQVEVEVEQTRPPTIVETPAARVESPRTTEAPLPRAEQRPAAVSNIDPGPVPTGAPSIEPTGAPDVQPAPGPAATGTSEYTTPAPMVQTGPGTGLPGLGGPAWSMPGVIPDMGRPAPAPTTSPRATFDPQRATKVLTDVLKEKDKEIGLDLPAAGTVASTVASVVRSTNTPTEGRATFEVKLSPTGQVLSVRVTSSTGGSAGDWAAAAAAVKASLAGRALGMTAAYAKGAMIHINVTSALTLPDGSKSAITQKGAGATFDVSNIGAHMQRVVKRSYSVSPVK